MSFVGPQAVEPDDQASQRRAAGAPLPDRRATENGDVVRVTTPELAERRPPAGDGRRPARPAAAQASQSTHRAALAKAFDLAPDTRPVSA